MFQELYKLYKTRNQSNRIPLEDFNTEAFAGILKLHETVADRFYSFLGLPPDDYLIKTQAFYQHELLDCFVDLILIGTNNVCFIENKVESSEGFEQLKRYSEVLDREFPNQDKYLIYCTKYSDLKNESGEYNPYNFKQIRWYEIAKILKEFQVQIPLVKDYLKFLTFHKMAQDNTIKVENLLSLENMHKTIEIMQFYLNQSKPDFDALFWTPNRDRNFQWAQINQHNRIAFNSILVLFSKSDKVSEILYSIEFESSQLNVQIYLDKHHEQIETFKNVAKDAEGLSFVELPFGCALIIREDLGKFLNNEDSDKLIRNWFNEQFLKVKDFVEQTSDQLEWREGLLINNKS